jgi:hypothetical protein
LLEATSGFLATRAIAGGGQNRPADCLQFHLAASAYLGEVFLLFLVHCDRPFVGPVYEVILALVRNVRNGVIQRHAEVSARCLFLSIADIGCGAFTRARPSPPEPIATELSRIRIKLQISVLCRGVFAPVEPRRRANACVLQRQQAGKGFRRHVLPALPEDCHVLELTKPRGKAEPPPRTTKRNGPGARCATPRPRLRLAL